jgi:hypothetical protein
MSLRMVTACGLVLIATAATAGQRPDCTLEPVEGRRQARLSDNVTATMTWSACNSVARDVTFEWPRNQGIPATSRVALNRAAALVREWERVTQVEVSLFDDLPKALETRAARADPYELGEDIPVTDPGFPGWDGVTVVVSSTPEVTRLTVHYWANP